MRYVIFLAEGSCAVFFPSTKAPIISGLGLGLIRKGMNKRILKPPSMILELHLALAEEQRRLLNVIGLPAKSYLFLFLVHFFSLSSFYRLHIKGITKKQNKTKPRSWSFRMLDKIRILLVWIISSLYVLCTRIASVNCFIKLVCSQSMLSFNKGYCGHYIYWLPGENKKILMHYYLFLSCSCCYLELPNVTALDLLYMGNELSPPVRKSMALSLFVGHR